MLSILDISASALMAHSQRMNTSASNLANADSAAGPDGVPYRPKHVVFEARSTGAGGVGGVRVRELIDETAERCEYRPGHPSADANGYVTFPAVDPVGETVNLISASRSYEANVEVMDTVKQTMLKTIMLGEG